MLTILISAAFKGAALIRGRRLFQFGYSKVRRLFEARRLLEEIRYLSLFQNMAMKGSLLPKRVCTNFLRVSLSITHVRQLKMFSWNVFASTTVLLWKYQAGT